MRAMDRRAWLREALDVEPALLASQASLVGMEWHDSDAWVSDFERWMLANCVVEIRGCQSVGSLHIAFCEWAIGNCSIPCRRDVFEELLERMGIVCADGFALSLMLTSDLQILKERITR